MLLTPTLTATEADETRFTVLTRLSPIFTDDAMPTISLQLHEKLPTLALSPKAYMIELPASLFKILL